MLRKLFVLLPLLAFGFVPQAHAASIVFNNGGPDYSVGWTNGDEYIAEDFVLTGPTLLTDAHLWVEDINNWDQTLAWAIYSDGSGLPDAQLASGTGTNISYTDTGQTSSVSNYPIYSYEFNLEAPLLLAPGTYWFALTDFNSPPAWAWVATSAGLGSTFAFTDSGTWYAGADYIDPSLLSEANLAFNLTGDPVPEPTTLLLLGTGLGAAAIRRRRTKRV